MHQHCAPEALDAAAKFHSGADLGAYAFLGFHREGDFAVFRVWAPHADRVSLIGDFNGWDELATPLSPLGEGGIWEVSLDGARVVDGTFYKFCIHSGTRRLERADPFAVCAEPPPKTASVIAELPLHSWRDAGWLAYRRPRFVRERIADQPILIYALDLGGWRRHADGSACTYRETAAELVHYVKQMGFTHVELAPLAEHPSDACTSAVSGLFAPTARYGAPEGLMELVDVMHEAGIGVLLDLPTRLAPDAHALCNFDGRPLYESAADPSLPDLSRPEVRSFLRSSAAYWIEVYHVDGFCLPAAAIGELSDRTAEHLGRLVRPITEKFPDVMLLTADGETAPIDLRAELGAPCGRPTVAPSAAVRRRILMGRELGQTDALRDGGVDWSLLDRPDRAALQQSLADRNHLALAGDAG